MKKLSILLAVLFLSSFLYAQVNVTVRINTSTNTDTITADNGVVQLRGETTGAFPDGNTISWDQNSTLKMDNVGGDYWEITFQMNPDDTIKYKAWTGFGGYTDGDAAGGGWEWGFNPSNGIAGSNTRTFISSDNDTVLDVQYNHVSGSDKDQYWRPFEEKMDSVAVYIRVNMAGAIEAGDFDPATDTGLGVRGNPDQSGGSLDWENTRLVLTRDGDNSDFWSGAVYMDKDSVAEGDPQAYKFVFGATEGYDGVTWENYSGDRIFNYPMGLKDTTIHFNYFSEKKPTGAEQYTSIVTWRVSTEALEACGFFDRGVGDKIEVRGPRGWNDGDQIELSYNQLLQEWTSTNEEFTTTEGTEFNYKYFVRWDSSRTDSLSSNYIPNLRFTDGWEEPAVTGGGNRIHVFQKTDHSVTGDFGFPRQFFNGVPANAVFNHDIAVTFNIDMTNATLPDSNSYEDLFVPGTDTVWVDWDGEMTAWGDGYDLWFNLSNPADQGGPLDSRFLILTDGDGDMVYSGTYTIKANEQNNAWYQLGYRITYSTASGDYVTNGTGGAVRGRRYYQYIHPTDINEGSGLWPETVWPTEYDLPTLKWTDTDCFVEDPPNLTEAIVSIGKEKLPYSFDLKQNYPNPFNPTTTITYSLAKTSDVKITIYNLMGQEVRTLINGNMNAGMYELVWNGRNSAKQQVASGVYFMKMVAGDFTKIRKMTLIR